MQGNQIPFHLKSWRSICDDGDDVSGGVCDPAVSGSRRQLHHPLAPRKNGLKCCILLFFLPLHYPSHPLLPTFPPVVWSLVVVIPFWWWLDGARRKRASQPASQLTMYVEGRRGALHGNVNSSESFWVQPGEIINTHLWSCHENENISGWKENIYTNKWNCSPCGKKTCPFHV